jgi:hypothetical protein
MDINTLAAWGEFLGGIAVVVSLVYLASQIRQNSKLLKASSASATAQTQFLIGGFLVSDPEVSRILWEGIADRASLSEADQRRFDHMMEMTFQGHLQQFEFICAGIALPLGAERRERGLRRQMQQPGPRQWWGESGRDYPLAFRDYVDGLIREGEADG